VIGAGAMSMLPLARAAGDLLASSDFGRAPTLQEAHAELESAHQWSDDAVVTGAAVGAAMIVTILLARK
jgi:hypothetical protein